MALLTIVNSRGHTVLEYDKTDEAEVEEVRRQFDELIGRGYVAYADKSIGVTFDPEAENTTVAPLVSGG